MPVKSDQNRSQLDAMRSHPNVVDGYRRAPAFQIIPNGAEYLRRLTRGTRESNSGLTQKRIEFFPILERPISSCETEKQLPEDENGHINPLRSGDTVEHSFVADLEAGIGTRIYKDGSQS